MKAQHLLHLLRLLLLTALGVFTFTVSLIGWIGLLEILSILYPNCDWILQNEALSKAGILVALGLTITPYYAYNFLHPTIKTNKRDYYTPMSRQDRLTVATTIKSFIEGNCPEYAWDDLLSTPKNNNTYQGVCDYLAFTNWIYPICPSNSNKSNWCNEEGTEKLKELADLLQSPSSNKEIKNFILSELDKAEQNL